MVRPGTVLGLGLLLVFAGCLGGAGSGNGGTVTATTPATHPTVETHVIDASPHAPALIDGGIDAPGEGDDYTPKYYVTTVAGADAAVTRFDRSELDEAGRAFVDGTDFGSSFIVVVQTYPQSSEPDYRVEEARRSGGTLSLGLNNSSPGGTDDVTVETLLIRVQGEPPSRVAVTTDGGTTWRSEDGIVPGTPERTVRLPAACG